MDHITLFEDYKEELSKVEEGLFNIFQSAAALLPTIGFHILKSGGKRLRPLFLLLSAEICGVVGCNKHLLAAVIEAIHTASLLHDDVIDGADTRRGKPSANSQWGNQTVILVGDYLYSNALRIAVQQNNQKIMEALSEATTRMTEGEILQLEKTGDPDINIEEYYRIISGKTGVLISAACRIGALLSKAPPEIEDALATFGLKTGMAFQLADDILDYAANQKGLGKKLGKDLEEGKITMPMILLLKKAGPDQRSEIRDIIRSASEKRNRAVRLKRIMQMFQSHNCIAESIDIASQFVEEARSALDVFEPSKSKDRLIALAEYSLRRDR